MRPKGALSHFASRWMLLVGGLTVTMTIAFVFAVTGLSRERCPSGRPFDLLVVNGTIVNGFGTPPARGNVAVCDDRIVQVGRIYGTASRKIDAHGLLVVPGFIDALGQSERFIFSHPSAASKLTQGITSELTGEIESVWPIPAGLSPQGHDFWASLDHYGRDLEQAGTPINIGTFVTAGSIRSAIMRDSEGTVGPSDLQTMANLVEEGMRAGAFGVSAALLYAPADRFTEYELTVLANAAAKHGGLFAVHLRSESDSLVEAVAEVLRIASASSAHLHIHHLKAAGLPNWPKGALVLSMLDSARRAGVAVSADMYPYVASATSLLVLLPSWARAGTGAEISRRLGSRGVRAKVETTLLAGGFRPSAVFLTHTRDWHFRAFEGMSLDRIARSNNTSPIDVMAEIVRRDPEGTTAVIFSMSQRNVDAVAATPWISLGTDAGALGASRSRRIHPRTFGTFAAFYRRYVAETHSLTLEAAVKKMSLLAAHQFRISNRGCLAPGAYADLVVLDSAHFADRATYAKPYLTSTGVKHVIVNGQLVLDDGALTNARPGRFLRSASWRGRNPVDRSDTLPKPYHSVC